MLINWLALLPVAYQVVNYSLIIRYLLHITDKDSYLILLSYSVLICRKAQLLTWQISLYYINDNNNDEAIDKVIKFKHSPAVCRYQNILSVLHQNYQFCKSTRIVRSLMTMHFSCFHVFHADDSSALESNLSLNNSFWNLRYIYVTHWHNTWLYIILNQILDIVTHKNKGY